MMTPHERQLLARIDRRGRWHSLGLVVVLVWLGVLTAAVFGQSQATYAAARQDRLQFPQSEWGYLYYVTTDNLPDAKQLTAGRTAAFVISSFSTAVVLEQHLPVEVQRGLWRIDLRSLNWTWQDWHQVLKKYPYQPGRFPPLVVRADWLIQELSDNFESDAGYRLLYGGKNIPKTLQEFQKTWGVRVNNPELALLHIENQSGVSLLHVRFLGNEEGRDRRRYWFTEDNAARNFNAKTDPLETLLDKNRPHDASEHLVFFHKTSLVQGVGGKAMQTFLANGQGERQDRAPVDIVVNSEQERGTPEIRNWISCTACHDQGLKELTENGLRQLVASGEELYADKKSQTLIEQQYLADTQLRIELSRDQEDYVRFVALSTGWSPEENVRAFKTALSDYDAQLTLEDAARETYMTPRELTLALGYASGKMKLGARLAGLPHGGTVARPYWESQYHVAYEAATLWKTVTR